MSTEGESAVDVIVFVRILSGLSSANAFRLTANLSLLRQAHIALKPPRMRVKVSERKSMDAKKERLRFRGLAWSGAMEIWGWGTEEESENLLATSVKSNAKVISRRAIGKVKSYPSNNVKN
jgi:hypothetical protein